MSEFVFLEALERRALLAAQLLADVDPTNLGSINPSFEGGVFTAAGPIVYFRATNQNTGTELWRTDGTTGGTTLVKDIQPGQGSSAPELITNVSGTIYFSASGPGSGIELWKTDGTEAGTVLVKDVTP